MMRVAVFLLLRLLPPSRASVVEYHCERWADLPLCGRRGISAAEEFDAAASGSLSSVSSSCSATSLETDVSRRLDPAAPVMRYYDNIPGNRVSDLTGSRAFQEDTPRSVTVPPWHSFRSLGGFTSSTGLMLEAFSSCCRRLPTTIPAPPLFTTRALAGSAVVRQRRQAGKLPESNFERPTAVRNHHVFGCFWFQI